ncbi:multisubunit Na+/H+ antiporter, MnhC subunit [Serpentinimonas raichei]|jgi:multicomponent Na+:H+ antiporter subunit C|uniref:Multisubunit Na+/H+ antiporter, MnhC subunit n=1 Tax=Serpentinimonas raichei TaxID=1458425 RepID=A0A060NIS7_9BURK|nr:MULTISPECIES: NADH-quinone oxidoreductase subunit K [Serpentinimonas]BAO80845.1 multisubunit Na+/H+ antiporter, MnhC subunit [Serpentinimonas raichei]
MIWLLALTIWITVTAGIYLALSRDVFRCVFGLGILGSAAILVLFASGRLGSVQPAVIPLGETVLRDAANPLSQALALTAIVIGFALICFSVVVALRLIQRADTDDTLALRMSEPIPTDPIKPPYNGAEHEPAQPAATPAASATKLEGVA